MASDANKLRRCSLMNAIQHIDLYEKSKLAFTELYTGISLPENSSPNHVDGAKVAERLKTFSIVTKVYSYPKEDSKIKTRGSKAYDTRYICKGIHGKWSDGSMKNALDGLMSLNKASKEYKVALYDATLLKLFAEPMLTELSDEVKRFCKELET